MNNGPLRICIAGSRRFQALERVAAFVASLPLDVVVVTGGAAGVDRYAQQCAEHRGMQTEVFPYRSELGRAGGPVRNIEMLKTCHYLVVFWDGKSRGTKHALDTAKRLGLEFEVYLDDRG